MAKIGTLGDIVFSVSKNTVKTFEGLKIDSKTNPVARGDYGRPIAALAGLEGGIGVPYAGGPLGGRMMVLCGLEDRVPALLPVLAQAGAGPDCLKAVLTDHNRGWNALRLFEELRRERRALSGK